MILRGGPVEQRWGFGQRHRGAYLDEPDRDLGLPAGVLKFNLSSELGICRRLGIFRVTGTLLLLGHGFSNQLEVAPAFPGPPGGGESEFK